MIHGVVLSHGEAAGRTGILDIESYDLFLDLSGAPARSRTEVRFRCRTPGAETFADVAMPVVRRAVLNGAALGPAVAGRLALPPLAAENVLVVDAELADDAFERHTDPADGAQYLHGSGFPSDASRFMACFDQPDLGGRVTLTLRAPAGWEVFASGAVVSRPAAGAAGDWRFAPVPGFEPYLMLICAGPFATDVRIGAGPVRLSVSRRASLAGADGIGALGRFAELARDALERYASMLGVPCPDPKYDIVFVPGLAGLGASVPGLMLVNESLLARMTDPDDHYTATVCAHEAAHLWFGSHVTMHWWDDLWLDEAMATYLSQTADERQWTAFGYRSKASAYQADELPGREPVSSPVASSDAALARPVAVTYAKGASVIRQAAALIGDPVLLSGLGDYLTRFGGRTARLDDMVGCWSRAAGRDLSGWASEWLRTAGVSTLRPVVRIAGGELTSFTVTQDEPRTHVLGIGLYDVAGSRLRRREVVRAEISGARCEVKELAGVPAPDAIVLNDGDLGYARIRFDPRSFRALSAVAMDVGDPLTESVCWNAAWQMVTAAELPASGLVDLILRRLGGDGDALPVAALEALTERAVRCADVWAPSADRARLREEIADAVLAALERDAGSRVLAAAFAASAQTAAQLDVLRDWLGGSPVVDADLRAKITFALAARGLAGDADIGALASLDPVGGSLNLATGRAMRPDPAAKDAAWRAALDPATGWQLAEAHARGIWVPGQEDLMTGYRDRYFGEALAVLARDGLSQRVRRALGNLLYPAMLCDAATVEAGSGVDGEAVGEDLALVVAQQTAVMRSVLAARSAADR